MVDGHADSLSHPVAKVGSGMTPTSRSLEYLRKLGYHAEVTEHWNSFTHKRKDLLGFGDIIAFNEKETLLIQATSRGNMNARLNKIVELPASWAWLANPHRGIIVIGWKRYTVAIERKHWRPVLAVVRPSGVMWVDPTIKESTDRDTSTSKEQGGGEASVSPVPSEG